MARRMLFVVGGTLVVALAFLVVVGMRVLERDRAELYARYGEAREQGIEEAARGVAGEVADIGDDLALASTLLADPSAPELAARELHAIATIKREYLAIHARTPGRDPTKVTAYDAPPGAAALADGTLETLLDRAEARPGTVQVSDAFAVDGRAAWYRVFARKPRADGPAVAVAVDTSVLLGRIKLPRDSMTRVLIVDARGFAADISDNALAAQLRERPSQFLPFVVVPRAGAKANGTIDAQLAASIGLPRAAAVVVAVPLVVDGGPPWSLLVAASTQPLQTQEYTLVRRVVVGGGLVLVLLLSAAAYVLHNAYRARSLRERVKHMDRLAHLTEKAEKILDNIPSGVLALSKDLRVTGVNRWLAQRIGRDVIGRSLAETFEGAGVETALVVSLVSRALELQEPQTLHRERTALLGHEAAIKVHAVPLAHGVGDVSVLLVLEDLSELRRIEQRLLHSEKLVTAGQLAAGIAHEIGTPLNVARGRVELSLSHLGSQHPEADNHRLVIDQIDRVTRLLQQLLDYVRPAPASVSQVDLDQSVRVVRDLLAPQAAKRAVTLDLDASGQGTLLCANADQVQQIIMNLTLNAIDACERGGTVKLRTTNATGATTLEVIDTGHGIPSEVQKQVFDPFFTTKKRGQGTGLGLWVVAQLVRAQSAEIELDSAPGRGTKVRVAWPVTS